MNHTHTTNRQILHSLSINQSCRRLIFFRLIHIRISRTVNNQVDIILHNEQSNGLAVSDVQLSHIRKEVAMRRMHHT